MLLDELLDARLFDTPPTRDELAALFATSLRGAAPNDSKRPSTRSASSSAPRFSGSQSPIGSGRCL